ncbi:MAG: ABC transporter permease [Burkholderiales bacterium]|nr:ABC transporter permease [Burkholderiales bacterium]
MSAWLRHHYESLTGSLARLARAPLATLFGVAVTGIAIALPAGLHLVVANLQASARALAPEPRISVFLALAAGAADTARVGERLKGHPGVRAYRFVSRDEALAELKASTGLTDVIESLERNPLPDAYIVEPRDASAAALAALRDEATRWPGVAHVQLDSEWAQRLEAGLKAGRLAVAILAALFGFALIAITFNTIRLQLLTRRDEIEVARLIGASAAFIRRPLLYFGALQGLAGGALAWAMLWGAVKALNGGLGELSALYGARIELIPLSPRDTALLLGVATALGWLGSWLSVARHLSRVDAGQPLRM